MPIDTTRAVALTVAFILLASFAFAPGIVFLRQRARARARWLNGESDEHLTLGQTQRQVLWLLRDEFAPEGRTSATPPELTEVTLETSDESSSRSSPMGAEHWQPLYAQSRPGTRGRQGVDVGMIVLAPRRASSLPSSDGAMDEAMEPATYELGVAMLSLDRPLVLED